MRIKVSSTPFQTSTIHTCPQVVFCWSLRPQEYNHPSSLSPSLENTHIKADNISWPLIS